MTSTSRPHPTNEQIERFADALHDRLCRYARSWGLVDISIETHDAHIDGELLFATGPDIGFTIDMSVGVSRYCELIGDTDERWLECDVVGIDAAVDLQVGRVTDGILAARRLAAPQAVDTEDERP
jgi:hypothetical protein